MPSKYEQAVDISNGTCNGSSKSDSSNFSQVRKSWHYSITLEKRNETAHKMVQAIFPTPDPNALLDKRMNIIISYARRVEGEMYRIANSQEEYHCLIKEKIYKIRKELIRKREERKRLTRQLFN